MANELRIGITMSFSKGGANFPKTESKEITVTGDAFTHQVQAIPTSNTALVEGAAIGTPGWVYIKNLDSTNFVTVGITGSYTIKLLAGEFCIFRAAGAIFVLADTATCNVEYCIIEL